MEPIETISEAKRELRNLKSCATDTDRFIARCLPLMMELYAQSVKIKKPKRQSEWSKFLSIEMKNGKNIYECAEKWKFIKADKASQEVIVS